MEQQENASLRKHLDLPVDVPVRVGPARPSIDSRGDSVRVVAARENGDEGAAVAALAEAEALLSKGVA